MDTLVKNIQLQKNYLVMMRSFEIGSLQEMIKCAYEGKDSLWKTNLILILNKFVDGLKQDINKQKDLLNSHICEHSLLILDIILFNLFTKQKKEERQLFNNSIYEGSQQSMMSQMSKFQNSEISNITAQNHATINQQFIENFKKFFIEFTSKPDFFSKLEELFKANRPTNELKIALKSLVKTIQYVQFKESFKIPNLEENLEPLIKLTAGNFSSGNSKSEIDEVNKILFGSKLDKIVHILTQKDLIGTQLEVHFAVGRIYFAAHSRTRSNFNRNAFKQLKYSGRDMIYNIIKHYVVNQSPDRQKTQICSQQDTLKYPIPAFILNYLQLLFMPIYNQFQELFDKHIMSSYQKDSDSFYQSIFSPTAQYIIPFFQNLPTEFCNFFTQFYQILTENNNQMNDKMYLFPVKQLFVNRFFLNPNLRQISLPISREKEEDYIEALNLFSKLFYNNTRDDKNQNQNPIFLKLNTIVQDCFLKLVTNYHTSQGSMDVYNLYIVDPLLKKDYNLIDHQIKLINFSEHEQKDYPISKFKQTFPQKKRIEQKQQMDIIREIATPINENISQKAGDVLSPRKNNQQQQLAQLSQQPSQYEDIKGNQGSIYQFEISDIKQQTPTNILGYQQSHQTESNNNLTAQNLQQNNNYQNIQNRGQSIGGGDNLIQGVNNQGMYQQGNYQINPDQEDSDEYLRQQLQIIRLKKQKLEEEQMVIERHRMKMESIKDQKIGQAQNIANYFSSYSNNLNQRNLEDKIRLEYEKQLTHQFEQIINNQKNNIELNENKAALNNEIILLHERNEFLKMIMKSRYPNEVDYIDTLDNKDNLEQWKKTYDLQQKQQERREKRQKRNEDDEFYYYQNIINQAFKKVEEADLKLEIHSKLNVEL